MKTLLFSFLLFITTTLQAQDSLHVSSTIDTVTVYANPNWVSHNDTVRFVRNLIDQNNCKIKYGQMGCGNPYVLMTNEQKRKADYGFGYIVATNTTKYKTYITKGDVVHFKWKDPDADTEKYYFVVKNLFGEVYDAFSVNGHEMYLNLLGDEQYWKVLIVSENCRKSKEIVIVKTY